MEHFTSIIRKRKCDIFIVKFEKVPKFCEVCGFLGHEYMEYGNGFHKEEDRVFGDWLIVEPPRRGRARGRSGPATRGGRWANANSRYDCGRGQRTRWESNIPTNVEEENLFLGKDGKSARKWLELGVLEPPQIPTPIQTLFRWRPILVSQM
jgi:hypothetical protein